MLDAGCWMLDTPPRTWIIRRPEARILHPASCILDPTPSASPALGVPVEIHHVLPPVVQLSARAAGHVGEVAQPPAMVEADVTVAPLRAVDHSRLAGELGIAQPVVAGARHHRRIAPIVVLLAIRR